MPIQKSEPRYAAPGLPAPGRWSPVQRRLHWVTVALLVSQALLALAMPAAAESLAAVATGQADPQFLDWLVTTLHVANGAALGFLVAWRVALRRVHVAPRRALPLRLFHGLLYVLLMVMVGSGLLSWFAGIDIATRWHAAAQWALLAAVVLHLAAAARHAVRADDVFRAMVGR